MVFWRRREAGEVEVGVNPAVQRSPGGFYNPLTGRWLAPGTEGHRVLDALREGRIGAADLGDDVRGRLLEQEWLLPPGTDVWHRFRLRVVALETHTVCNQACVFCPVSHSPRAAYFMEDDLFESVADQLVEFRDTLEAIFLMNYNEPTLDRRLGTHVRMLAGRGLPVAINTNGTGLTPRLVEELVEAGPLRFLSINLNTIDRERYRRERGKDQLELVLTNLDHAGRFPVAEEMVIAVLGDGDERHRAEVEAIGRRFEGSRFEVRDHRLMDRAGHVEAGQKVVDPAAPLRGCDNLGSRPFEHLHVSPRGRCVLCCEDYDEDWVVGDLTRQSVREVLEGEPLARFRRWAYGAGEAPPEFICRGCIYALRA